MGMVNEKQVRTVKCTKQVFARNYMSWKKYPFKCVVGDIPVLYNKGDWYITHFKKVKIKDKLIPHG
jgi:hypothetical protein